MPGAGVTGHIARLSPAVNPQTRSFPLEGRVPNPDGRLKPGAFARVHIVTDLAEQVLTVPAAAFQDRYGVNRVFVVKGDRLLGATEIKYRRSRGRAGGSRQRRHGRRDDRRG